MDCVEKDYVSEKKLAVKDFEVNLCQYELTGIVKSLIIIRVSCVELINVFAVHFVGKKD